MVHFWFGTGIISVEFIAPFEPVSVTSNSYVSSPEFRGGLFYNTNPNTSLNTIRQNINTGLDTIREETSGGLSIIRESSS